MTIELKPASGHLLPILQRSVDLVAFGLQTAQVATVNRLDIPSVGPKLIPSSSNAASVEDTREAFRTWVLANSFRDCIEAIGESLEWSRRACFLWTRLGRVVPKADGGFTLEAEIDAEDWNEHAVAWTKKFDRLTLPKKFDHLQERYGWSKPDLADEVLSLNAARNCLVHRGGVVGQADTGTPVPDALQVAWVRLRVLAGNGVSERDMAGGGPVKKGEVLRTRLERVERLVPLGAKIVFSATDFVEIAMTLMCFATNVEQSTMAVQNRRRPEL